MMQTLIAESDLMRQSMYSLRHSSYNRAGKNGHKLILTVTDF